MDEEEKEQQETEKSSEEAAETTAWKEVEKKEEEEERKKERKEEKREGEEEKAGKEIGLCTCYYVDCNFDGRWRIYSIERETHCPHRWSVFCFYKIPGHCQSHW